jgi:hypothetical protein
MLSWLTSLWLSLVPPNKDHETTSKYVNVGFLGCDAAWTSMWVQTFQKHILPPSAIPQEVCCFKTLLLISSPLAIKTQVPPHTNIFTAVRTWNLIYIKTDHDHFLIYPFIFIIYNYSTISYFTLNYWHIWHSAVKITKLVIQSKNLYKVRDSYKTALPYIFIWKMYYSAFFLRLTQRKST